MLRTFFILFGLFLSPDISAQNFINAFQIESGFISEANDLYVGKLQYGPYFQFNDDRLRLGFTGGIMHSQKSIDAIGGVEASFKMKNFSALNDNISLGGIFLTTSFEIASGSEKIIGSGVSFQFPCVALHLNYGRDLEFNNNWITYGFTIHFRKKVLDHDE